MNTTIQANGKVTDSDGFAPGTVQECDNGEHCETCGHLGWILCNHQDTEIEFDPYNADGYMEWCTRCDTPAGETKTWTWCPQRQN